MSNREYEARRDLLELHSLVDGGMRQSEIARVLAKDPAWVSRSIARLRDDPNLAFRTPEEGEAISQHLARLETLYRQAFRATVANRGQTAVAAIRVAATVLQQLAEYQSRIGVLKQPSGTAKGDESAETETVRMFMEEVPPHSAKLILERLARSEERRAREAQENG